jgi:hypothetical protein
MKLFRTTVASILLLQVNAFQMQQPSMCRSFKLGMSTTSPEDVDTLIQEAKTILYAAAETKAEDSDKVVGALLDLEKLMRKKNKEDEQQMQETVSFEAFVSISV